MKLAFLPLSAVALASATLAQDAPPSTATAAEEPSGTIIIYRRGSIAGLANACPVRYKGKEIVELGRSKAFIWKVKPGRYILENKTSSVEVSVDPGETRYVRCAMKVGIITYRADLQIADGTEYDELKSEFEEPDT